MANDGKNLNVIEDIAWYECIECQAQINRFEKVKMIEHGEWIPVRSLGKRRVGFDKLSSLYSPWLTWGNVARRFLETKDYPETLMNFLNSWLAEVWKEKSEYLTREEFVKSIQLPYEKGVIPN